LYEQFFLFWYAELVAKICLQISVTPCVYMCTLRKVKGKAVPVTGREIP
jgi:hypothetical protein